MWVLRRLDDGEVYPLFLKSEHIIGRFGNLELSADSSVSRKHATIVITLKKGEVKFILRDLGSKYGTYLNEGIISVTAMQKMTSAEIKIGDRVKFGMQNNLWILEESRFVTCTSMLSSQDKANLKSILNKLNGDIVSDWTENCTHLTMTQIKTTIKAIYASTQVKPIVSLDYWERLAAAFSASVDTPLPDCDEFVPPIAEPQLKSSRINMKMNKNRKTIFQGFKFIVFGAGQLSNILPIVKAAGGTAIDGNRNRIDEDQLCEEKVVVVQSNCNEAGGNTVSRVLNILQSNGLRAIIETEIYVSIFECSTERYCNPRYDASILLRPLESQVSIKDEETVLAAETQDIPVGAETQFLETASGNFTLAVGKIVFSESDDEDVIPDSDPTVVGPTPPVHPSTTAAKRKLPAALEDAVKIKNAKLDKWLLNKKDAAAKDSGGSSASESIFSTAGLSSTSSRRNQQILKDMFSFRVSGKGDKAASSGSSSIFSNTNNNIDTSQQQRQQRESAPLVTKDQQQKQTPVAGGSSIFAAAANGKPSSNNGGSGVGGSGVEKKVSRTAALFGNANNVARATRSSARSSLFGGQPQSSSSPTARNTSTSKRKRGGADGDDDDVAVVTGSPSKSKLLSPSSSSSLSSRNAAGAFERRNKRPAAVISVSDSDDDDSEAMARKTSRLAIGNKVPIHQDTPPVDIPSRMSLSQFQSAPAKENVAAVKTEAVSPVEELDKSIVYTVSLIGSNRQNIQSRIVDNSVPNFKQFRKNHVCYPSSTVRNGTKLILFSGRLENGFADD